ncbi:Pimeloyl-[acyl-carrier protein] methyl ester esterase [Marinomonas spartinae]|uniref:Pimeloyl-[acyl-carrier protein] methyl ester esterase n=1 Tax=Marinomonas spartinae TaxID=1792290 RepID=A0A1A8TJH9_9GAMM|nr:alpha/beta fold hydrolase [Marinomonas spartinae]SBS26366.1 Pimeloyl-[acyl-carrier protein] methyl ester esterase [Marinomonas spartinae]SBS32692.1 Pimeloyl-[acyl-carrier protein] methyl ester esterase [Marinomonas spartinae]
MRRPIETEQLGDSMNPAIFMVPGWGMPKEVMRPLAERLSDRFYVVLANLPGVSLDEGWIDRTRIGPNYDIDALSEQLIAVAPKDCWWIGWSLGGMVSAYVAARRSSCVKGLITLSASPSFLRREGWPHGMEVALFDEFATLTANQPEQGLKRFVMLQTKGAVNERRLVKQLQSLLPTGTLNKAALVGGLRLLKTLDVRREWSLLDRPNLHILGRGDALVSYQTLTTQTDVNPHQEVIVMPDIAHQSFMENESACLRHIEQFINANSL